MDELKEIYEGVRTKLLNAAEFRDMDPQFHYETVELVENHSQIPIGFTSRNLPISIRIDESIIQKIIAGKIEELIQLLDDPQLIREIFGPYDEMTKIEKQPARELEKEKEAA